MEFVVTLLLLYLVQCAAYLPRESVLFARAPRGWRARLGAGWRLLPARPGADWLRARRFPLRLCDGALYARSPASRFGWREPGVAAEPLHTGAGQAVAVAGKLVHVSGRPFYRAASKRSALRMSSWLRSLEAATAVERIEQVEEALRRSLSLPDFEERRAALRASTRLLDWLCDLYVALLFVGIPGLILFAHEERGLQLGFVAMAGLHALTVLALALAHRRLYPGQAGELFESLLSAALYPPILLRAPAELRVDLLGEFHPLVAAGALLPEPERLRFFRAELVRLEQRATAAAQPGASTAGGDAIADLERRAAVAMLEACGASRAGLLTPPPKQDASARSFCPICAADYVRAAGRCTDCGVGLIAYVG